MENLSHTLLGLSLAKAGLDRATPLGTTALAISSNLPDIDVLMRLGGGTISYLEHHRGFTHSFVGLALLAVVLTFTLVYVDRKFRLRRDPFGRPIKAGRIFWVSYLGGLGHLFMDFTNSYGVRPLLPFSNRWFYGDISFVADPWIWLILGSGVVWLTLKDLARVILWLVIGTALSLLVALAFRNPDQSQVAIPTLVRIVWFVGITVMVIGALLGWSRAGARLARYSLLVLAVYYGGMWMARQSAREQAQDRLPVEAVISVDAWPTPANPLLWQSVAATEQSLHTRFVDLTSPEGEWREIAKLDSKFVEALRRSTEAQAFLRFTRYAAAAVEEQEDGYRVALRDLRFPLQMSVTLDRELAVKSADVRWY